MREQDRAAFIDAAASLNLIILVRHTNAASLRFIGKPKHYPKPIDCKAKTADTSTHPLAGLVVSPTLVPAAFSISRQKKAVASWIAFEPVLDRKGSGYDVISDKTSEHYGCVTFQGNFLHGDYDLKDIILPGKHMRRNFGLVETLRNEKHIRGYKARDVIEFVNRRIGIPVLQHGAAAQYGDHEDEPIDRFMPDRTWKTMTGLEVDLWYQEIQRPTIGWRQDSR